MSGNAAVAPADLAVGAPTSPKCSSSRAQRNRTRKKVKGRVHWDEQVIEEHNKERGTRQKIDEPDTPFVRSPQTASDSEGGVASSDDEHRLSFRAAPKVGPDSTLPPPLPETGPLGDMDPLALASRLDRWVQSGAGQRRASTSSSVESSDGLDADVEYSRMSSACSSRSSSQAPPGRHILRDLEFSEGTGLSTTTINTNTNINMTVSKSPRYSSDLEGQAPIMEKESSLQSQGSVERESGRAVCFSGESGGESSEDFRKSRHQHYNHEWRLDPSVAATVSSLETNTNTNLNAGSAAGISRKAKEVNGKNPMEGARPPVKFDAEGGEDAPRVSDEFRTKRQMHYDEVKALNRFRSESGAQPGKAGESSEEESPTAAPGNPMEPREVSVAFEVGNRRVAPGSAEGTQEGQSSADSAVWQARRLAHYSEMAAALRSMPPPSDDEEEEDEGDAA